MKHKGTHSYHNEWNETKKRVREIFLQGRWTYFRAGKSSRWPALQGYGPLYDGFLHMMDDMLGPSPMHIKYSPYVYDGFCIWRTNFPGPIESVISKFTCTWVWFGLGRDNLRWLDFRTDESGCWLASHKVQRRATVKWCMPWFVLCTCVDRIHCNVGTGKAWLLGLQ